MTPAKRPPLRRPSRVPDSVLRLTDVPELLYWLFLGDELRKRRESRGWTCSDLRARLRCEVSVQTLGCYELALRRFYVMRLVELCVAMDESPEKLLARVHDRITSAGQGGVQIRLSLLAAARDPALAPAARWAHANLRQASASPAMQFGPAVQRVLAGRCALTPAEFAARLRTLND
ncbi:XRE family transcriptional regulator (plasmid) [Amycolatopsis sp. AA4]|uniref:helix-turn-helix domain-containing protein n=1 Tax=Actinomycetes TaxID=1760 RepID=UPI0001B55C10|nr:MULTISPECIES: hypothetical protein [Actinomycetes]ATY17032.1 XRE family transcriptional regulator [Amycolatopsis sp. AA4]EFL12476.1 predicted protein [Streptomyces sp. AA4]